MRLPPLYDTELSTRDHSSGYKDTGCFIAPKCLECPLPACVFDEDTRGKFKGYYKRAMLYPYLQQSNNSRELAELANINRGNAQRYIRMYQKAGGDYLKFIIG